MLSPLILAIALPQGPTAAELLSSMLLRYASAKSLSATLHTTQTANGTTVVTDSALAYERPGRIRLDQRQQGPTIRRKGLLVSDGTKVAYTKPDYLYKIEDPYLFEEVKTRRLEELYSLVGSALPDRSPILDVLVAGHDDQTYFAGQLATFGLKGKLTLNGKAVNAIEGDWRETPDRRSSGRYQIYLTDEGEIVRYVLTQSFAPPTKTSILGRGAAGGDPIKVTTTWDATVQLNPTFKEGAFSIKE